MIDTPLNVVNSINKYKRLGSGRCDIHANSSDCIVICDVGGTLFSHTLNGIDFNKLLNVFGLLDIEYKVC